jgi:hypothetical protein
VVTYQEEEMNEWSLDRTPGSTWLRVSLITAALATTAVLSTGCVPVMAAVVVAPMPAV